MIALCVGLLNAGIQSSDCCGVCNTYLVLWPGVSVKRVPRESSRYLRFQVRPCRETGGMYLFDNEKMW